MAPSSENSEIASEPAPVDGTPSPSFFRNSGETVLEIAIADEQNLLSVDENRLREVAEHTLKEERVAEAEISIALVDHARMRPLNRDYLGHDYDTDVLSFPLQDEDVSRERGRRVEGEVILNAEMAQEQAERFHWSFHDELVLYLVHGLLHLCGYDDLSENDRRTMRCREKEVLAFWNLTPHYREEGEEPNSANRSFPADGVPGETP